MPRQNEGDNVGENGEKVINSRQRSEGVCASPG